MYKMLKLLICFIKQFKLSGVNLTPNYKMCTGHWKHTMMLCLDRLLPVKLGNVIYIFRNMKCWMGVKLTPNINGGSKTEHAVHKNPTSRILKTGRSCSESETFIYHRLLIIYFWSVAYILNAQAPRDTESNKI